MLYTLQQTKKKLKCHLLDCGGIKRSLEERDATKLFFLSSTFFRDTAEQQKPYIPLLAQMKIIEE